MKTPWGGELVRLGARRGMSTNDPAPGAGDDEGPDERPTYRERRGRRAERLRGWADSRDTKASAARDTADAIMDAIPMGQPVLIGHHSQRRHERDLDRLDRAARASAEHGAKAAEFRQRADNIEAAADHAIYDDDPDAAQRLTDRIAELEAERARCKAYNASCRKAAKTGGTGDLALLDDAQRADLLTIARVAAFQLGAGAALPAYKLSNLSANITRNRKRLAALQPPPGPLAD